MARKGFFGSSKKEKDVKDDTEKIGKGKLPPSGKKANGKKKSTKDFDANRNDELESLKKRLEALEAEKKSLEEDLAEKDLEVFELSSRLQGSTEHSRYGDGNGPSSPKLSAVGENVGVSGSTRSNVLAINEKGDSLNARRGSSTTRRGSNASAMTAQEQSTSKVSSPHRQRPTLKGASNALMQSTRVIGRQSMTPEATGSSLGLDNSRGGGTDRRTSRRPSDAISNMGTSSRWVNGEVSKRSASFIAKMLSEHLSKQKDLRSEEETSLSSKLSSSTLSKERQDSTKGRPKSSSSRNRANTAKSGTDSVSSLDGKKLPNRSASYLRRVLAHKTQSKNNGPNAESSEKIVHLPRGGVYVNTSFGPIQFGMPPETIKDSMSLGLPVPTIFVVPNERFNLSEGVNVSEIEFPAFFNFFVLKKKIRLVTYPTAVPDLRAIMQEALLGPEYEFLYVEDEYSKFVSNEVFERRANHVKEMEYFAAPRAPFFYQIDIDNLIEFEFFDEENHIIEIGGGVRIKDNIDSGYEITDSAQAEADATLVETLVVSYEEASSCLKVHPSQKAAEEQGKASRHPTFAIPQFGVTVLGNSHGFDPEGSTSGFVVWVNGQGVMVDPPPHSSSLLHISGIMPKFVTAIILTHCHADHEVGTIQKMVTEDKVTLMTTPTIFESFLRKYAAVSGLDTEFLRQLVNFRPVFLEEPTYWNGANFRFFYSLHSIPCIGFEVSFSGKRLVYSADTYFDKKGLQDMHGQGVLSKGRLDALLNFPWDCDVVLHEAGVPPIHTPIEALEELPKKYQKNIYLIHIGGKAARDAEKRGFKIATAGVEHTIILKEPNEEENKILKILQLLSGMDIFRGFGVNQALELLFMASEANFKAGDIVVEKGTPGDKFLIIVKGAASVTFGGAKKVFVAGDYLGEISVITGDKRTATVIAETDLTALEVDRYAFDYLVMHDPTLRVRMENLIQSRSDGSWKAIMSNSVLSTLSASQKTQLQALLTMRSLRWGEVVWKAGEYANIGVLISKGGLRFEEVHGKVKDDTKAVKESEAKLTTGMLIFDMFGHLNSMPLTTTLVCETQIALVFTFNGDEMIGYLDQNPLLMLSLLKSGILLI